MPRRSSCAVCGVTIAVNKGSRPDGQATCRPCRWAQYEPHAGSAECYKAGCRSTACVTANSIACRAVRQCVVCRSDFFASDRIKAQKVCSATCQLARKREHGSTRRALMRGAYVSRVIPAQIHDRDQWRCYICSHRIDPAVAFPHPRAATIDHLVPLSKGGTHEPSNVRTACHACNAGKGNRGGNEQLMLVG